MLRSGSRRLERAELLSMQSRVDLAGYAAREAWHGLELFEGGVQERLGSAEVVQDLLLARRPDAGKLVEMAELCEELLEGGAPGLHFYTLNRSKATLEIFAALNMTV